MPSRLYVVLCKSNPIATGRILEKCKNIATFISKLSRLHVVISCVFLVFVHI